MARLGLSRQECDEVLEELRRECSSESDELLRWFADSYALDASCDFDLNDLIGVLHGRGQRVITKRSFADGSLPASALQSMIQASGRGQAECPHVGGVVIFRATPEKLGTYWGTPIGEMMTSFRSMGRDGTASVFGVLTDEQVEGDFEIFVLRVVDQKASMTHKASD